MSGIEVAGLVLGGIPLVISALEHYSEGISTVGKWWSYKRELASLVRVLDAEYARFLGTCEKLLEDLVPPARLRSLIDNPGGPLWKDPELDRKLKSRLHRAYSPYMRSVGDMAAAVKELEVKLELDADGKPRWGEYRSFKHEYKRIKFSLSSRRYEEAMKKIEKNNDILANLTDQNMELEPARKRRQRSSLQFKTVQEHAKNLYDSLNSQWWACDCGVPHCANLRLDARLLDSDHGEVSNHSVQFKVVFSLDPDTPKQLPWSWRETDIRSLEYQADQTVMQENNNPPLTPGVSKTEKKPKSPNQSLSSSSASVLSIFSTSSSISKTKKLVKFETTHLPQGVQETIYSVPSCNIAPPLLPINDICVAMQQYMKKVSYNEQCLGYLAHQHHRLGVYLKSVPETVAKPQEITSLANLFNTSKPHNPQTALISPSGILPLSRGSRLSLALTVASSVLQLHKTPWLRDHWDKTDILVRQNRGNDIRDQAFVSRTFPAPAGALENPGAKTIYPWLRNATLFALGVVLIELCLGQTLAAMRSSDDPLDGEGKPNALTDWTTADRLLEAVYSEAGTRYGDAVRRCLYCDFDQRNTNLDDDAFRQAVYDGVVAPLEDNVRAFYQT